jgi:hypothetical protein
MADDLFFSRDTKVVVSDGTAAWEIPVLDGFSFSQATNSSEVTLNEMESSAGVSSRGRKMFNDSVAAAEWSFSTYARPFIAQPADSGTVWEKASSAAHMHAIEEALWAGLVGKGAFTASVGEVEAAWDDNIVNTTASVAIDFLGSNKSTVKELDIYFIMGSGSYDAGTHQVYKLAGAVVNSATIDFDIDGISTIQWSGFAKTITDEGTQPTVTINEALTATTNYIRNRLTSLAATAVTTGDGNNLVSTYNLTLTGGSISFENNISYLTPETIGSVNSPIGHVTGSRAIGGSFTCYLSNSSAGSSDLFEDLVTSTGVVTNDFALVFSIGGASAPKMVVTLPNCHLEVPTHSIEDVISMEATFSALPGTITSADEATIAYTGVAY